MIQTVAQFLHELMQHEARALADQDISHAPTIGSMYEGLSASVLSRAVPPELGLQVVSGFIEDGQGTRSGQIDCMVVAGVGRPVPYTSNFVWHIKDVIAVFEIKKNLYRAELADAFTHLAEVKALGRNYDETVDSAEPISGLADVRRVYSQLTGSVLPLPIELDTLSPQERNIFTVLLAERIDALRIVLGYTGYRSEANFRDSLYAGLQGDLGKFGIGDFPHLMISGEYAMVKTNGMPYLAGTGPDGWHFYCSAKANPVLLILEFIWTRLDQQYGIDGLWGDDLTVDMMNIFLSGKIVDHDGQTGWALTYHHGSDAKLAETPSAEVWEPEVIIEAEATIFQALQQGKPVDFSDRKLLAFLKECGIDPDEIRESLLRTRLVAMEGNRMHLIIAECDVAILPDGRYVVADNRSGRLYRWLDARLAADDKELVGDAEERPQTA